MFYPEYAEAQFLNMNMKSIVSRPDAGLDTPLMLGLFPLYPLVSEV